MNLKPLLQQTVAIVISTLVTCNVMGQTIRQFSDQINTQALINPGFTSIGGGWDGILAYRNQWTGHPGSPKQIAFNLNSNLKNSVGIYDDETPLDNIGVGIQLFNDKFGLSSITSVSLRAAFKIRLSLKKYLSTGVNLSAIKYDFDIQDAKLLPGVSFQTLDNIVTDKLTPNFGFGLLYYSENLLAGFSIQDIFSPTSAQFLKLDNTFNRYLYLAYLYRLGAGFNFSQEVKFIIKPTIMWKGRGAFNTKDKSQLDVGINVLYHSKIWFGISHRLETAIVASASINIYKYFWLGYSFDYAYLDIPDILKSNSHEVVLKFEITTVNFTRQAIRYY